MKKNDFLLVGAVCIAALFIFLVNTFLFQAEGAYAVVTVDGVEYGSYNLGKDVIVDIGGKNRLVIKARTADMTEADCPDKLCVKQKAIHKTGQTIVCLPNKTVVEIQGAGEREELDAVAD